MKLHLGKQERLTLLTSILVLFVLVIGGYYFFIYPKKQEISQKEIQLETEERLLAALRSKTVDKTTPTLESVAELQKKVPVKKQLEQFIIDLNKAEVMSNSLISNMNFSEGTVTVQPDENNEEGEGEIQDEMEIVAPPEGIKKLIVNLAVTSPSYQDLMTFLDTLEGLNRRVVIESVAFSGGSELTSVDQERQEFSYSIALSAFYMPELEDLADQLPELEAPAPSLKKNPFATSAEYVQ